MAHQALFKAARGRREVSSGPWLTWSDRVRTLLDHLNDNLGSFAEPELVHLKDGAEYDATFTLRCTKRSEAWLRRELDITAAALLDLRIIRRRWMFCGMIRRDDSKTLLHLFFALLRQAIVDRTAKPMSAMYAPLGTTGTEAGEFRLHADLYLPHYLFNLFNQVPEDGTGASTFLSVPAFRNMLREVEEVPHSVREEIESLFRPSLREDGYERFVHLVHDDRHPWHDPLWSRMQELQEIVPLVRGEGYLLNDRMWLHGRTLPSNRVTKYRVHRLVFCDSSKPSA